MMAFSVDEARACFPALQQSRGGVTPVFLDGPAGSQVPAACIDAMVDYLKRSNANVGGVFATSQETDRIVADALEWAAAFVNAGSSEEIVFGPNMTSLAFHLSRSLAQAWNPGDEIIVTRLDHDANIRPWLLAANERGVVARFADIQPEDVTLDLDSLRRCLTERTRLVAVTCASNLVGSLVDVATICRWAHEAGAVVFLDAVHLAPHRLIDVRDWGCDFLACSAYKFFGPHLGILWGKRNWLEELPAYKVRPAPDRLPWRWMTGTQNHEGLAGLTGTFRYLAGLAGGRGDRRRQLQSAYEAIAQHETILATRFLNGIAQLPGYKLWGLDHEHGRVPTFALTHKNIPPAELAARLAERHVYAWSGNSYAIELTERLGLESQGGVLRLGWLHYHTVDEVDRTLDALVEIV